MTVTAASVKIVVNFSIGVVDSCSRKPTVVQLCPNSVGCWPHTVIVKNQASYYNLLPFR